MTEVDLAGQDQSSLTVPDPQERPTLSVPEAGRIAFGLSRAAAYNAAERGEIPTIRVGRRLFVPTAVLRAMLGIDAGRPAA